MKLARLAAFSLLASLKLALAHPASPVVYNTVDLWGCNGPPDPRKFIHSAIHKGRDDSSISAPSTASCVDQGTYCDLENKICVCHKLTGLGQCTECKYSCAQEQNVVRPPVAFCLPPPVTDHPDPTIPVTTRAVSQPGSTVDTPPISQSPKAAEPCYPPGGTKCFDKEIAVCTQDGWVYVSYCPYKCIQSYDSTGVPMATCGSKRESSTNGPDTSKPRAVERGASFECIPGASYCEQDHKRIGICDQDHHYIIIGTCPGHCINWYDSNGLLQATCGEQKKPIINGTDAPEPRSLETRVSETCVPGATYCEGETIVVCDQNHNITRVSTCPYKCIQYNDSSNIPIATCEVEREAVIKNPEKSSVARGDVPDFQNQYYTECMGGHRRYFTISEYEFFPIYNCTCDCAMDTEPYWCGYCLEPGPGGQWPPKKALSPTAPDNKL